MPQAQARLRSLYRCTVLQIICHPCISAISLLDFENRTLAFHAPGDKGAALERRWNQHLRRVQGGVPYGRAATEARHLEWASSNPGLTQLGEAAGKRDVSGCLSVGEGAKTPVGSGNRCRHASPAFTLRAVAPQDRSEHRAHRELALVGHSLLSYHARTIIFEGRHKISYRGVTAISRDSCVADSGYLGCVNPRVGTAAWAHFIVSVGALLTAR
jgi:hypothetical protein